MKRFSFRIVLFAAALCCGAMPANAQTLTFSGLANSCGGAGYTAFGGIYVESGYQLAFSSGSYYSWCTNQSNSPLPSGNAAIFAGAGDLITLSRVGGGTFGLSSIDLASVYGPAGSVVLTGNISGGGTVVSPAEPWNAWVSNATLQTDVLSGFNNLTSVTFSQSLGGPYFQFDNVVIGVTPEPATMTLMATGLVGIVGAGIRRRKRA